MYEVYLADYPTNKSSIQTAFIQTIEDGCTLANGLTMTGTAEEDPHVYTFDGTITSILNTFSPSIPACSITYYDCNLDVGGVTKSCDYDDGAGTFSRFDANTGAFTYSSSNKDNA